MLLTVTDLRFCGRPRCHPPNCDRDYDYDYDCDDDEEDLHGISDDFLPSGVDKK